MNKRFCVVITLMLCCMFFATAQTYGFKSGLNLSNLKSEFETEFGDVDSSYDMKFSFYLGALMELPTKGNSKFQIEVLYQQNRGESVDDDDSETITMINSEIQIPILYKFLLSERFYLYAGPYLSLIIDAREKHEITTFFEGEEEMRTIRETYDVNEFYRTMDVGLIGGLEYNLENGLFIEARYDFGLANISRLEIVFDNRRFETSAYNRIVQIGIGYKF